MVRKEAKKVVLKDAEGNYIVPVIDPADKGVSNNYVDDKIEEYNIHRNYIKSCALDGDGNADLLRLTGDATITEKVGIVLGTDTNESAYVVNGQFNISGDGENTQNYDQTYTLKTPVTSTTSVQVTLHQWAAHRAGSNIYAHAIFDDGTSQQVGFLAGGGDTNQTQTFTVQVEQKTLTGIRITAHSSAWSNGYAGRGANTAGIYVTHYVTTSSGIVLNVSEDKPLKYVPSDGASRSVTIPFTKDLQSYNDGTFFVFLGNNNISTTVRYTINKVAPTSPVDGDYWLDISSVPTQLKKYNGTSWQISQDCYVGSVTVASNVITKVVQPIIKGPVSPATVVETYQNGTSGYRVWSDGYCHQWGNAIGNGVTVSLLKTLKDTDYHINLGGGVSTGWSVAPHSFTYYNVTASSFQIRMEEASNLSGGMNCNWDVFGYLAGGEY